MRNFTKSIRSLMFIACLLCVLLIMPFSNLYAQVKTGDLPPSFELSKLTSGSMLDVIDIYPPNTEVLRTEDEKNLKNGTFLRVGVNLRVDAGLHNSGTWTNLPDGQKMWRLKIQSDGAQALKLAFDDFYLSPGTQLYFYNANQKQVIGKFTADNNREDGNFYSELIQGEAVYIEYIEPSKCINQSHFNIESIAYVYRETDLDVWYGEKTRDFAGSQSCEVNINCTPVGDDWQDEKRGVARIFLVAGGGWGW